ncbi:MAG: DUF3159 domain-containing protein [Solirubrobacterales bacterium]|nr:DUF3159 domain-containing protein [Solirubrobacterales bacterium]
MGGAQGIADSSLPALLFVVVYTLFGNDIQTAGIAAVALGGVIAIVRLMRGESARFALTGFFGVALAAFIASRSGRAEDFFLPGLLLNAGYAMAYLVSILVRWPLIGVLVGPLIGEGMSWRRDPARVKLYSRASWVWFAMFVVRLVVQLPLYLAGSVVALGIAKTAMGLPVFALALWLTYLILRSGGIDLKAATDGGARKRNRTPT